jgi:uncharacterized protein YqjF (DUF2071 family)
MEKIFLTAKWQHLIMANYVIDPKILQKYLPPRVEIDFWNQQTYVSLVGFLFKNTKVLGISIPFHQNFEEVNLRFYVRYKDNGQWKRGVVFVREIVPLPTIAWTANILYREPYSTMPMKHEIKILDNQQLSVAYHWKYQGEWNELSVKANSKATEMQSNSEAEFITEHYWGYTKWNETKTAEYQVEHPKWKIFEVNDYKIRCNIKTLYGNVFAEVMQTPSSVLLAEGSDIIVRKGRFI